MKEYLIFIPIKSYEKYYAISKKGDIWSYKYKRCLKPFLNNDGYWKIELYKNSKRDVRYIHRLIGQHFIPNVWDKKEINHKDGNKKNNILSNLEWVTPSEQMQHAWDNELIPRKRKKRRV